MSLSSIYAPEFARLAQVRPLTELEKLFTIELPQGRSLGHVPGQFVMVSIPGVGEAPISITSSPSRSNGRFELCVRRVGDVTGVLHGMGAGALVGVRGPMGHGFPIDQMRGKDVLFAPGGLGLAPLRSLINQVLDERKDFGRVLILYGAKRPAELLFREELEEWAARDDVTLVTTVDPGGETPEWNGQVGFVTPVVQATAPSADNAVAVLCGPPIVVKLTLPVLAELGFAPEAVFTTLENRMKCGVGKCGRCNIGKVYVCKDGPVFTAAQLAELPAEF